MKAVWCLLLLSIAYTQGFSLLDNNIVIVPPQYVPDIISASLECVKKLSLNPDILTEYFAWRLGDSESNRKYTHCLGVNSGYFHVDGTLVKSKLVEVSGIHKEKVDRVVDECNKLKSSDEYETAFRVLICFRDQSGLQYKIA